MNLWMKEMQKQWEENEELIRQVSKRVHYAPKGTLRISHYRGKARYYLVSDQPEEKDHYLGKQEVELRDRLAQKLYDQKVLTALKNEQAVIERVNRKPPVSYAEVFDTLPAELQAVVEPVVLSDEEYVQRWLEEMSRGASGDDYKSRVEVIYARDYENLSVPFVYEPALYLEGYGTARPDFAVLNVRTRQTFYHEHFGMMDDPDYRKRNLHKLNCYHKNGFYEGINLIITMESDGGMIDYGEMEELIKKYCW